MHSVNVGDPSASELGAQLVRARAIWHAYLKGQLATVGKAALWWSTFGIIAVSMLGSNIALAATRGPFNLALLLSSPLAGAAAEKWSIRSLLIATTSVRFVVWTFLIPMTWILFKNWLHWPHVLWTCFVVFMLIDGNQVAFSNAVDIDCGGLDTLSSTYDLPLTDFLRYRFTTVHQLVFDSSFVLFTPPVVLVLLIISNAWTRAAEAADGKTFLPSYITGPDLSVFVLAMGVALMFAILSLLSLRFYAKGIPAIRNTESEQQTAVLARSLSDNEESRRPQWVRNEQLDNTTLSGISYKDRLCEMADGFYIIVSDRALQWRLLFLAAETALEDTMVSVIIPMIALNATTFLGHTSSKAAAALINVVTIAVGKLGGVLAGVYLASSWSWDGITNDHRKKLFDYVLMSSVSLVLVPLGFDLAAHGLEQLPSHGTHHIVTPGTMAFTLDSIRDWIQARSGILGCVMLLLGVAFFFVFSTAPKIGFASLIQSLVTHEEDVPKVFGFVGMFVTLTDGLTIVLVNLILYWTEDFSIGLWMVVGLYLAHGLLERMFGARLIQESRQPPITRLRAYRAEN